MWFKIIMDGYLAKFINNSEVVSDAYWSMKLIR